MLVLGLVIAAFVIGVAVGFTACSLLVVARDT